MEGPAMAVRRIREHVVSHNWFAVFVDLVIVTIGVFIGIQVSNWNAGRLERGEARAYQAQIIDDLIANEQELAERARYYRQVRTHALAAMQALEAPALSDETFLVDSYQATQVSPIRMERSAYDEMIAGGMVKSFAEPAGRRRLSSYYAGTERLEEATVYSTGFRDRIRREMMFDVQQRLRERCSDAITVSPEGLETITVPLRCSLGLPRATIARAAENLKHVPELKEDLARHIGDLDVKVSRFDRWLQVARETRRSLERLEMS
jgi:hypothetical protein